MQNSTVNIKSISAPTLFPCAPGASIAKLQRSRVAARATGSPKAASLEASPPSHSPRQLLLRSSRYWMTTSIASEMLDMALEATASLTVVASPSTQSTRHPRDACIWKVHSAQGKHLQAITVPVAAKSSLAR